MIKKQFTRNAFKPVLQAPQAPQCSCKARAVNAEPIAVEEMLPEERYAYEILTSSYGAGSSISGLLYDHFVSVALDYAGELIDRTPYWTLVMPRDLWLEALRPLIEEGMKQYLTELDQTLDQTSGKLDNPYNEQRLRTIALTETTMSRTCGAMLLMNLNNTLAAVARGEL